MSKPKELAPQRHEELRRILRKDHVVRVEDLAQQLNVSPATIRRDLEELESLGEIRRVHGGAVGVESRLEEPLFDDKTAIAAKEKQRIARAALKFIKPNDTIYLDGGSTVLELARLLRDRTNITIVTNSLRASIELAAQGSRLMLIGGELRRLSQTLVGPLTRLTLEELHIDKAFMGTIGLTLEEGLTTTDPGEAYTKELVMERAREVYLLADHSKAGKVSFTRAGRLEKVRALITDSLIDRGFAGRLRKRGVEVIKA
ncbi:MAG: DeoR/GlpR family DNA-binding transcription regulator [Acidobacteriia bacterium]|nr:DeoR/GlpR family DNA-binding transcription regulator [Terriglobia bacterium]